MEYGETNLPWFVQNRQFDRFIQAMKRPEKIAWCAAFLVFEFAPLLKCPTLVTTDSSHVIWNFLIRLINYYLQCNG